MVLGLTFGCLVLGEMVWLIRLTIDFILGSSLRVHLLKINLGLGYDNPKSIFLIRI